MSEELPEGWARVPLRSLFDCWGGMTPSTGEDSYWNGTVPWVSSKDVKERTLNRTAEQVTQRALTETRLRECPVGSVLVVVRSGVLAHTLPVAVTAIPVVINQDVKALYSASPELNNWLAAYLRAHEREILAANRKEGTTVQSIRVEELLDRELPVAPLAEQRRIVEKVEALLEQVNQAKARLDRVPLILKKFRQSVLAAACSGELTREWRAARTFRGHSPSTRNDSRSNGLPDHVDHLEGHDFPDAWQKVRVDELVLIQNGRAFPSKEYMDSGGVRLLRPGNLHFEGRVEWTQSNTVSLPEKWAMDFPEFVLGEGELLMNLTAQSLKDEFLGRACLKVDDQPAILNQRIARFAPLTSYDVRPYLLLYFKSEFFRRFVNDLDTGSLIRHMHSKDVARHVVPLPPPEEQSEIVAIVRRLLTFARGVERRIGTAADRAGKLPQAILSKAFAGELVPTEAELARAEGRPYESAEELLKRITATSVPEPTPKKARRARAAR